jgi:DNA-binding response OmpR family regulator
MTSYSLDAVHTQPLSRGLPGSARVLVIEDETDLRDTIELLITIEGCEARGVSDGRQALELLRDWTPDLILLDLTLPTMSGDAFIKAYQQTAGPHAPIIVMTGMDIEAAEATGLGAAAVMRKPFDVANLLEAVARFVDCSDS